MRGGTGPVPGGVREGVQGRPGGARGAQGCPGEARCRTRGVPGSPRGLTGGRRWTPRTSRVPRVPEDAEAPSKVPKGSPGVLPGCPRLQNVRFSLRKYSFFSGNRKILPGARPRLPWGSLRNVEGCLRETWPPPGDCWDAWGNVGGHLGVLGDTWGSRGWPWGGLRSHEGAPMASPGIPRSTWPPPGDSPRISKISLSPALGPRRTPKSPTALPGPLQRPPRGHPGLPELYVWTRKCPGLQRT